MSRSKRSHEASARTLLERAAAGDRIKVTRIEEKMGLHASPTCQMLFDGAPAEPTPFDQRDADLTPIIVTAARKLKRVLADEQNEVLETLRGRDPVRDVASLLPDADAHVARYVDAIEHDLADAANVLHPVLVSEAQVAVEAVADVVAVEDVGVGAHAL